MRKADYATLASRISARLASARRGATAPTEWESRYAEGARDVLESLARDLAGRLSVDAREFLKACGLTL